MQAHVAAVTGLPPAGAAACDGLQPAAGRVILQPWLRLYTPRY